METIEWQDIALQLKEKLNTGLHYDRVCSRETKETIMREIKQTTVYGDYTVYP